MSKSTTSVKIIYTNYLTQYSVFLSLITSSPPILSLLSSLLKRVASTGVGVSGNDRRGHEVADKRTASSGMGEHVASDNTGRALWRPVRSHGGRRKHGQRRCVQAQGRPVRARG